MGREAAKFSQPILVDLSAKCMAGMGVGQEQSNLNRPPDSASLETPILDAFSMHLAASPRKYSEMASLHHQLLQSSSSTRALLRGLVSHSQGLAPRKEWGGGGRACQLAGHSPICMQISPMAQVALLHTEMNSGFRLVPRMGINSAGGEKKEC